MKPFLIEFEHDSNHLGLHGLGQLLVYAHTFELACERVKDFRVKKQNSATGYEWMESFKNARNFINLTME